VQGRKNPGQQSSQAKTGSWPTKGGRGLNDRCGASSNWGGEGKNIQITAERQAENPKKRANKTSEQFKGWRFREGDFVRWERTKKQIGETHSRKGRNVVRGQEAFRKGVKGDDVHGREWWLVQESEDSIER